MWVGDKPPDDDPPASSSGGDRSKTHRRFDEVSVISDKELRDLRNMFDSFINDKSNRENYGAEGNNGMWTRNQTTGPQNMGQNNTNMNFNDMFGNMEPKMNQNGQTNANTGVNNKIGEMGFDMFNQQAGNSSGLYTSVKPFGSYGMNIIQSDSMGEIDRMNKIYQGDMGPLQDESSYMEPKEPELVEKIPRSADPEELLPDDGTNYLDPELNGFTREELANPAAFKFERLSDVISDKPLVLVSRKEWGARPPRRCTPLKHPINNVVISFKSLTAPCYNKEECIDRMRRLQRYHMEEENLSDIPYNFLIGHDGSVYEGRGWDAHSSLSLKDHPDMRGNRIDIAYLGDYRRVLYPVDTSNAILDLIHEGCEEGKVNFYYDLHEFREGIMEHG